MNKKLIIILTPFIALIVIGAYIFLNSRDNSVKQSSDLPASTQQSVTASEKSIAKEPVDNTTKSATQYGNYITLDTYRANPVDYLSNMKVYFFHASWCPICQSIHKEIENDISKIPKNVTLIKTDFDKETALRKKYGVNTQYTFVQIDNSENEIAQWSATSLDKVVSGIKL